MEIIHTTLTGTNGVGAMMRTQIMYMLDGLKIEKKNGVSLVKIMTGATGMIQKMKCGSITANPLITLMNTTLPWC